MCLLRRRMHSSRRHGNRHYGNGPLVRKTGFNRQEIYISLEFLTHLESSLGARRPYEFVVNPDRLALRQNKYVFVGLIISAALRKRRYSAVKSHGRLCVWILLIPVMPAMTATSRRGLHAGTYNSKYATESSPTGSLFILTRIAKCVQ